MKLAYAYHCLEPIAGLDALQSEHERCTSLWDELVDIDRATERRIESAAAAHDVDAAAALREIAELSAAIGEAKNRDERLPLIRARRDARARLWDGIKRWRKALPDEARDIERDRQAAVKAARQSVTVDAESDAARMYWPNSNSILARYEAARAGVRKFGRRLRHHDPLRDDGMLAVQIQRTSSGLGAAPDELAALSMLAIAPVRHGARCKERLTHLTMRVDAAGNKVTLPMMMHRPLPKGCRVKGAQICWRRVGLQTRWQVVLQLADVPTEPPAAYRVEGSVELAWEQETEGGAITIARPSWRDPITLPEDWVRTGVRLREQQSWLDTSLDEQRRLAESDAALSSLLSGGHHAIYALRREQLPPEMREWLVSWRRMWWQTDHGRRKWLGRRREIYRLLARELVRERTVIAIDDRRLDKIARAERATDDNGLRQMVAPHLLRQEIVHQARKVGTTVIAGDIASGKVLTESTHGTTGAWQRRKSAKAERSQAQAQVIESGPA